MFYARCNPQQLIFTVFVANPPNHTFQRRITLFFLVLKVQWSYRRRKENVFKQNSLTAPISSFFMDRYFNKSLFFLHKKADIYSVTLAYALF